VGSDVQIKLILKQSLERNGASGELRCRHRSVAWSETRAEIIRNVSLLFRDRLHVKEWGVLDENFKDITLIYTVQEQTLFIVELVENSEFGLQNLSADE
jgi:hypothetical protein